MESLSGAAWGVWRAWRVYGKVMANFLPNWFEVKILKEFTPEEQQKYERIQQLIRTVAKNVGIPEEQKIHFQILTDARQNACMMGSVLSWGGPRMFLTKDYFDNFGKGEVSADPELQQWQAVLKEMPDQPVDLGKYFDACSVEKRKEIREYSKKFTNISDAELTGIIAHEIAHAKYYHLLQTIGITGLCFIGLKATADALGIECNTFRSYVAGFFILSAAGGFVSQAFEKEADSETGAHSAYNEGLLTFFKNQLIYDLAKYASPEEVREKPEGGNEPVGAELQEEERVPVQKKSCEELVKEMIEETQWFSTHPNHAKRVVCAIERRGKAYEPSGLAASFLRKTIAVLGVVVLVKEIHDIYQAIFGSGERKKEEAKQTRAGARSA